MCLPDGPVSLDDMISIPSSLRFLPFLLPRRCRVALCLVFFSAIRQATLNPYDGWRASGVLWRPSTLHFPLHTSSPSVPWFKVFGLCILWTYLHVFWVSFSIRRLLYFPYPSTPFGFLSAVCRAPEITDGFITDSCTLRPPYPDIKKSEQGLIRNQLSHCRCLHRPVALHCT